MTKIVMIPKRIDAEGCFFQNDLVAAKVVISDIIRSYSFVHHVYVMKLPKEMRNLHLYQLIPNISAAFYHSGRRTEANVSNARRISRSKVSITVTTWLYS